MVRIFFLLLGLVITSITSAAVPAYYGSLKSTHLSNANIAYYRFGHGNPILFITGHGDNMNMWPPILLKKLSQQHEIIIFDYPGIGNSTSQNGYPNTMEQLALLVNAFIQNQKLIKPDVIGFSMGGSLLLYMASQHSDLYHHLIVVGAKAGGEKTIKPDPKYFKMLSSPNLSPAETIKVLLFPADAQHKADDYLASIASLPQETMNKAALDAQAEAVTLENQGKGIWDQLPQIKNEIMIVNGTEDILTPVQNAVSIANSIPASWLIRIKHAGHGVLFQEPLYMGNLIEIFLNDKN